jgi:YHS domain-containing protein
MSDMLKGDDVMAKDPVCKMDVKESEVAEISTYKDIVYYFCASSCKEKFDKEPEKYIKETGGPGSSCGCCC